MLWRGVACFAVLIAFHLFPPERRTAAAAACTLDLRSWHLQIDSSAEVPMHTLKEASLVLILLLVIQHSLVLVSLLGPLCRCGRLCHRRRRRRRCPLLPP